MMDDRANAIFAASRRPSRRDRRFGSGSWDDLAFIRQTEATILKAISENSGAAELSMVHEGGGVANVMPERTLADLTPCEQHVLAALKPCLPSS